MANPYKDDMKGTGELWNMTDDELKARAEHNSEAWYTAETQEDKDGYHAENVEINKILDSHTGETTTFDPDSGTWSPRKEPSAGGTSGQGTGGQGTTGKADTFTYDSAPEYLSKNQEMIDAAYEKIMGRPAFSYDPETDPAYQQYKDQYTRQGKLAMEDTLGQVSARTGGLASSYAGSAAQQSYNQYMSALADKVPELRQLAYQMYRDEGNDMRSGLDMLLALDQRRYGRYQDELGQYNADQNFKFGVWSDQKDREYRADETAYQRGRDALSDQRYKEEQDYARAQDQYNKDLAAGEYMAGVGQFGKLAQTLGLSEDETQELVNKYAEEHALTQQEAAIQIAKERAAIGDWSGYDGLGWDTSYAKQMQDYNLQAAKPQSSGPTEYTQNGEEKETPKFKDRTSAIEYMQQMGIEGHLASAAMDEKEWKHCKAEFRKTGKGDDTAAEYDTYSDYLNAYVQYCIETYGK